MKLNFNIQDILRKLTTADIKVRYGVFAGILLLVGVVDYLLIMGFQLRSLSRMGEQIKTSSADIQRVKSDEGRISQINQGLTDSRLQLQAMSLKVRSLQEMPAILEQISSTANQYNVKIDQIKPMPASQEVLVTTPEGKYYGLPIVIQARSGYHMFGRFLNSLESGNLFFSMHDLRIEAGPDMSKGLSIQVTLKVIVTDKASLPGGAGGPKL